MAMGKPPNRPFIPPNIEVEMLRTQAKSEDGMVRLWPSKWGWILDEYKELRERLEKISEKSLIVRKKEITDHRTICPIPQSVNHEYGWLAAKPEFRLDVYGKDTFDGMPLPEELRFQP